MSKATYYTQGRRTVESAQVQHCNYLELERKSERISEHRLLAIFRRPPRSRRLLFWSHCLIQVYDI